MIATTCAYSVRHRNGWGTGFGPHPTHCHQCGAAIPAPASGTGAAGYGLGPSEPIESHPDAPALRKGESLERSPAVCYACCGARDCASMIETGRATLYLSRETPVDPVIVGAWRVTNWPSSLKFRVLRAKQHRGAGGFGAQRTDAWFIGPDGFIWHAVNRGDNQIARCRRTRERAS